MKLRSWQLRLGLSFLLASSTTYLIQIALFHRKEDTVFYLLQDLAFLPVQVFLVTILINDLFKRREQSSLNNKMNMVIGAFYSEVGNKLIKSVASFDARNQDLGQALIFRPGWKHKEFAKAIDQVRSFAYSLDAPGGDLSSLKTFLVGKRTFLLGLLENANLLEHEMFTDLLWAVMHLTEELDCRDNLADLGDPDRQHISQDMQHAYRQLLAQWLAYNEHLQRDYPYIYSLAMRTNPFDPAAQVEIR